MTREAQAAITIAVGEAIRKLGEVPSGHLYAEIMGHMDIDTYNLVIASLVEAGLVRQCNYLLTWVGPKQSLAESQPHPERN